MEERVTYDPNKPLTDKELESLPFELQLEYLDSMGSHLRSIPLPESPRNKKIIKEMSNNNYFTK